MQLVKYLDSIAHSKFSGKHHILFKILLNWESIIGSDLKNEVVPIDLLFQKDNRNQATILLEPSNDLCKKQIYMIQGQLIKKISNFLGYNMISKVQIASSN